MSTQQRKPSEDEYTDLLWQVYEWGSKHTVDVICALIDDCDEREVAQIAAHMPRQRKAKRKVKKGTTKGVAIEAKVTGRCMKCKRQRRMVNTRLVKMNSNGAPATKGECGTCGTGMFRMGAPEGYEPAPKSNGSKPKPSSNGSGELRGPSGKLRNFGQMSDEKLAELVKASKGTKDSEGRKAVLAAARNR